MAVANGLASLPRPQPATGSRQRPWA